MKTDYLKNSKTKTISLDYIKSNYSYTTQEELKKYIDSLIDSHILEPIKSSEYSFEKPYVKTKYRLVNENEDDILNEINSKIVLDMSYYKHHPKAFMTDLEIINKIEEYKKNRKMGDIPLSINERSLEIFRDEKMLLDKPAQTVISRLGLTLDFFNVYESKEIFMYYKNPNSHYEEKNILIVENKDTWQTIKNVIKDGLFVLGVRFDVVIYGEGKKILSSFGFIDDDEFCDFNSPNNNFYYFGDVDSTGINIMDSLITKYPRYNIKPFYPAYEILFSNIDNTCHLKYNSEGVEKSDNNISQETIDKYFFKYKNIDIYDLCITNKIIPQETLNNRILRTFEKDF